MSGQRNAGAGFYIALGGEMNSDCPKGVENAERISTLVREMAEV